MGYLKEVMVCASTAVALYGMYSGLNGNLITAVFGFWGVLLGHEVTIATSEKAENAAETA